METPPAPFNEDQRLAELLSYEIMDTSSEDVFDQLTALASQICGTPIALISLVDQDRQWFKSKIGLDAQQTHRNVAFCAHAILQDQMLEVTDAQQDPRFSDNPLVTGYPNIRFYAGTPLVSPRGFALGTLCTLDNKPRKLDANQRKALSTLGAAVIAQMELRRNSRELQRSIEYKDNFLSYLSHEIRTPLNAIAMFSRQLGQQVNQLNLPLSVGDAVHHIQTGGDRLLDIVDSVLNVKQMKSGRLLSIPRTVVSKDYLANLFNLLQSLNTHTKLGWVLDSSCPPNMVVDDTKLSQIISILVNHCSKRLPADEQLLCEVTFSPAQIRWVCRAQSPLFSEQDCQFLNAQHHRFDEQFHISEKFLDLSICKNLIALLDGQLTLITENELSLAIPLGICAAPVATANDAPTLHIKPERHLLIVEDNEINQIVISSLMDELGISHALVSNGEDAICAVSQGRFDLIIMDIGLPGISGLEATETIRASHPELPIVALTADAVTDRDYMLSSGLNAILTKPIAMNELIRMLNHYLAA